MNGIISSIEKEANVKITDEHTKGKLLLVKVDTKNAVSCPLNPGEASFHHGLTLHASQPNNSNDRRIGLNLQFITTDMKQLKSDNDSAILVRGIDDYNNFKMDIVLFIIFYYKDDDQICYLLRY